MAARVEEIKRRISAKLGPNMVKLIFFLYEKFLAASIRVLILGRSLDVM